MFALCLFLGFVFIPIVLSSFAIILMGKIKLVSLLKVSSWYFMTVRVL